MGLRWKPSPCRPGPVCQVGGLAASLRLGPWGWGTAPGQGGPQGIPGRPAERASAAALSRALRAWRPLAQGSSGRSPGTWPRCLQNALLCRWGCEAPAEAPQEEEPPPGVESWGGAFLGTGLRSRLAAAQ